MARCFEQAGAGRSRRAGRCCASLRPICQALASRSKRRLIVSSRSSSEWSTGHNGLMELGERGQTLSVDDDDRPAGVKSSRLARRPAPCPDRRSSVPDPRPLLRELVAPEGTYARRHLDQRLDATSTAGDHTTTGSGAPATGGPLRCLDRCVLRIGHARLDSRLAGARRDRQVSFVDGVRRRCARRTSCRYQTVTGRGCR